MAKFFNGIFFMRIKDIHFTPRMRKIWDECFGGRNG